MTLPWTLSGTSRQTERSWRLWWRRWPSSRPWARRRRDRADRWPCTCPWPDRISPSSKKNKINIIRSGLLLVVYVAFSSSGRHTRADDWTSPFITKSIYSQDTSTDNTFYVHFFRYISKIVNNRTVNSDSLFWKLQFK